MPTLHFGALLRQLRQASNLSLRGLAHQIGVSPAYLSQVETGKEAVPASLRLNQIELALGLPRGLLVALTDRVDPRALAVLQRNPAATELLLAAEDAGLSDADIARIARDVRRRGARRTPAGAPLPEDAPTRLAPFLTPERCFVALHARNRNALFGQIVAAMADTDAALDPPLVIRLLNEREAAASTAVGAGIAMPHACVATVPAPLLAVATLADAVGFTDGSGDPVSLVFLLVSPSPPGPQHVRLLARIARLCREAGVCDALRAAPTADALYGRLRAFDQRAA